MTYIPPKTTPEDIMEGSYDRPMGVSLLSVLLLIGGILLLITQLIAFNSFNQLSSIIGVSNIFLQLAVGFLGLIGIAAGVGMWLGKRWGWWLALFYFAYSVTRNVNVLITLSGIADQFGTPQVTNYIKYGIRALWNCLLLCYMCREDVTSFFNTTEIKRWKELIIVFGLCIVLYIIGTLL